MAVAWSPATMAVMGAGSVDYHRVNVLDRGDDYPGRALEYYGSPGETPLVWGGTGAARLGLSGPVSVGDYELLFGVSGARGLISVSGWSGRGGRGSSLWCRPTSRLRSLV